MKTYKINKKRINFYIDLSDYINIKSKAPVIGLNTSEVIRLTIKKYSNYVMEELARKRHNN